MADNEKKLPDGIDCSRRKLHSFNWLADIPGGCADFDIVEVQFKNTRKGYYATAPACRLKQATWWLSRHRPATTSEWCR